MGKEENQVRGTRVPLRELASVPSPRGLMVQPKPSWMRRSAHCVVAMPGPESTLGQVTASQSEEEPQVDSDVAWLDQYDKYTDTSVDSHCAVLQFA